MKPYSSRQSGFITAIVIIIAAILVLRFVFSVDVIGFLRSARVGEWVGYTKGVILAVWEHILRPIVEFIKGIAQ